MVTTAERNVATRTSVARQSAMTLKLSTNQRSACWTWLKAPAAIISSPNDKSPAK